MKQDDIGIKNYIFSEKFAEQTLNSLSESISITDMDNYIIFVNAAFCETYGYTREELIGKNITFIRADNNDIQLANAILPNTKNGAWVGRILNKRKDGTVFWVALRTGIVRDDEGNPIALVGSALDLTQTILAENELKEVQDKYRSLFNDIKDVVYESTPDGKLLDINNSGVELFGYNSKEELLAINLAEDVYVDSSDRDNFKMLVEARGYVKNYEITIKKKNKEQIIVLETAYAYKDQSGKVISYRGILRDISDVKYAELQLKNYIRELANVNKQLSESEEELRTMNSAKDKLFSIIAHDLRSPFTALIGFSDYLCEDLDELTKDEVKLYADRINQASKNVYNLLENLLEWSRIESGRINPDFERINLYGMVDSTISLLKANATNKNIDIVNDVDKDVCVIVDRNMISSVFRNLLSNAIKFTFKGKKIVFKTALKGKYTSLSVTDEGVGMDEKTADGLFSSSQFHTTLGTSNEKGSGLGLIICKELVDKNGGKIKVESTPGKGTTFTVYLLSANV